MLFDKETQALIFGYQVNAVQRMLDFDYVCRRETPSVAAVIDPTREGFLKSFWGSGEILIPIYKAIEDASKVHPKADVLINFASFRSAYSTTVEALEQDSIRIITIIAEGVPERHSREIIAKAKEKGKLIIGPATVGAIRAGAFKVGNTAGTMDNIVESKLYRPGSVGFVSKSGGMLNEMFNIIARNSDGIYEGVAIGGDKYPGSTLLEHLLRYEQNPEIKLLVCLGELGGYDEIKVAKAIKDGRITKPLVIWVTGTCAKMFPTEVQFGHAGAKAESKLETADAKNDLLRKAGAIVPNSFDDFGDRIKEIFQDLKKQGKISSIVEFEPRKLPMDFREAVSKGIVRRPSSITCTISDDRGEEPTYVGISISQFFEEGYTLGDVIGLLWFKKKLPTYASKFIEMVLMIIADHGPAVSGAHNAIVAASAGKDVVSSLCSGLLTVGPRFGGAIDDAAKYFKDAHDRGISADGFVKDMKAKGINIPGIGHRIKSVRNPDKRVQLLVEYARKNFPTTEYLDYALEVEKITTAKRGNLILNVDGCIGVLFLDLMKSCSVFTPEEVDKLVKLGCLNGLFLLGRSIGIIGHVLDQYRLRSSLYRHPFDDILYVTEQEATPHPQRPVELLAAQPKPRPDRVVFT
jgi:succinyl-CoA synthetase alpha subunit